MKRLFVLCGVVALIGVPSFAAVTTLYANNATGGAPYVYQIDATTGAVLNTYTGLAGNNGRGVVNVNNILYYTDANSGNVYRYDIVNGQLTNAFNIPAASGLSSITYDGTNFFIGDYSGTNKVFEYSPTGSLINTITLSNCSGFCDGLTFFKVGSTGYLLSNRFDGGFGGPNAYDVYDINGGLVTSALFTSTSSGSTGVAWDGSSFWTSNIFDGTITQWSMSGVQMGTQTLTGYPNGFNPLIEGMSFNFAQTVGSPEPGTLVMFGSGLLGLLGLARRKLML